MRKALQLDIAGHRLFGTLHDHETSSIPKRTGVLLLSFGQQPRSWVGDLGSAIADRLDTSGYPTFRFDMPGLGDTPGDIPIYLEELWRDILLGAHEAPLHALCEELVKRYKLKGLVIGGFCGGAVTALYAVNSRSPLMLGLVLLEPEMALVRTNSPTDTIGATTLTVEAYQESTELIIQRLTSFSSWRKFFNGKADFKFWSNFWFDLLEFGMHKIKQINAPNKTLPPETNTRMYSSWQLARRFRIPTLVITVGTANRSKYYRAYGLEPGRNNPKNNLEWVEIPNTTHALLTGGAKESLCASIEKWISKQ